MDAIDQIPVDRAFVDLMVACILRKPRVFLAAAGLISPEHFNRMGEEIYPTIWGLATEYMDKYGNLPDYETLSALAVSQMGGMSAFGEEFAQDADSFLSWAYGDAVTQVPDSVGIDLIRRFLVDRAVTRPLQQALQTGDVVGLEMPALLQRMQAKMDAIDSIRFREDVRLIPEEWSAPDHPIVPTGIPFIDERMAGGMAPGEVYTLIGPTGVGKTLLAVQLVASFARTTYANAMTAGDRVSQPLSIMISYEDDFRAAQLRALSFVAEIPHRKLISLTSYDQLSRRGTLEAYEMERFRHVISAGQQPPGEYDRLMDAKRWLDDYMKIADFSGARVGDQPPRGSGGVREIVSYLRSLADRYERPIGMVVIDWAGSAVRRSIQARNGNISSEMTPELLAYCDNVRTAIATTFDCPVWVMHQASGAVNKRPPTSPLHHSDAEYCKAFSVNAWFAFCLGTKDRQTNTCLLSVTKTRRNEAQTDTILRIDGNFARMVAADNIYMIDPVSRRIISREEALQIGMDSSRAPDAAAADMLWL